VNPASSTGSPLARRFSMRSSPRDGGRVLDERSGDERPKSSARLKWPEFVDRVRWCKIAGEWKGGEDGKDSVMSSALPWLEEPGGISGCTVRAAPNAGEVYFSTRSYGLS
jgi:hypothetical protein